MQKEPQVYYSPSQEGKGSTFIKGMTLDQYLSKNATKFESQLDEETSKEEQNLYESSKNVDLDQLIAKNTEYCINEIDQQSMEDSNLSHLQQQIYSTQKRIKPKDKSKDIKDTNHANWRTQINSISMNVTAFFKGEKQDRNSFRIKQMSMSPSKKTEKNIANGSITIYGSKFGQITQKKSVIIPELVTVTGRASFYGQLHRAGELTSSNQKFKKKETRANLPKKTQLDLNQLIGFQSRIKNNYYPYIDQIKVEKTNRVNQRKNKFC